MSGEDEGDKLIKEATKLCQPSMMSLRLKADWDNAVPLYERAAMAYKQGKSWEKARGAFEKAAVGQERLNSPWHAAKHLEKAAECAKELNNYAAVTDLYKRAAEFFAEAGRGQAAAEALARGARTVEDRDPKTASMLYLTAMESLEAENKAGMAGDIFRSAIGSALRSSQWADAVGLLLRWGLACQSMNAAASQCRAYLGAVVVWLYGEDARQAYLCYQDALEVPAFVTSEEAFAADDLFNAYRSGKADEVKALIASKSVFMNLDNQVARIAKKLPQGNVAAMAADLVAITGKSSEQEGQQELDEDDLT